jgi:3-oxoacyl-[acyl-carrier-protein] synthase-3
MNNIEIKNIEYHLPNNLVTNENLNVEYPDWDIEKVGEKSGVKSRHIASKDETALDLSIVAIEKLIANGFDLDSIDGIIFCTQSPDFIMPSNAFLIHKHFNFKSKVWAFDYNLACSGYVYGLSISRGMISTGLANNILLINADTYSKYINEGDRSTRVLFGDGAAVTVVGKSKEPKFIDVILETAGSEYESFYIPAGACRIQKSANTSLISEDRSGNLKSLENIQMNGFAVWKFISNKVPHQIKELLQRNNLSNNDIDFFGFHQASKLTLDSLIKSLGLKSETVYSNLSDKGNTVSASIPILLKDAIDNNKLVRGDLMLLSGFGVGLSWGSALMKY